MSRKINVRCDTNHAAMSIFRRRHWGRRMVYVLCADRKIRSTPDRKTKYRDGGSRIIYVGETRAGNKRPAGSMASRAKRCFGRLHGVRQIDVYLLTCKGVQRLNWWESLEKGLLATFRKRFGALPYYNQQGKRFQIEDITHFSKTRLQTIVQQLS
jgi:hypothetical protein